MYSNVLLYAVLHQHPVTLGVSREYYLGQLTERDKCVHLKWGHGGPLWENHLGSERVMLLLSELH